jgi:hypothetical protein
VKASAVAPPPQRGGVARGVGVGQPQVGHQRQCRGAFHAGPHAASRRGGIDGGDAVLVDQRHRYGLGLRRQRGAEGFQRQQRQVQGQAWGMRQRWQKTGRCPRL